VKTVGLTGGIASGKSTVARLLRQRGVPVIDADQVSRRVVAPGSPGLAELLAAFGPGVLAPDGSLDRPALGARVVADPAARKQLEAITHPRIAAAINLNLAELAQRGEAVAVVEAALMVESGSFRIHDAVILVRCAAEQQLRRLEGREGWTEERARAWLAAQLSSAERETRLRQAQAQGGPRLVLVDNDADLADLAQALDQAWAGLSRALDLPPRSQQTSA